jgi:predicted DNA-binding transcriptional regulator AlpA
MESRYVTEKKLAEWLDLAVPTIQRFRYENRGPRYVKFGSSVRYAIADVEAWIASQPTGGGR